MFDESTGEGLIMRIIVIGCEYSGVTTLLDGLNQWGIEHHIHFHMDDHFTIPDAFHLSDDEQQAMLAMLPTLKERFQRFQTVYHVRLISLYEQILLGGFHIEEKVYGPRYYYPGLQVSDTRRYETEMPADTILVHLHARPEVIKKRMQKTPHPHTLIEIEHIPDLLAEFEQQYHQSWIQRKIDIDTSDLASDELLDVFFARAHSHLEPRDALLLH